MDLVAIHQDAIAARAYGLYQQGIHDHAPADWHQAQAEVLRAVLTTANQSLK